MRALMKGHPSMIRKLLLWWMLALAVVAGAPAAAQQDRAARALALQASQAAKTGSVKPRSIGQFTLGSGRWERVTSLNTSGVTYEYVTRRPLPISAGRFCLGLGQTPSVNAVTPKAYVSVAAVPTLSDADITAATPTLLSFAGNSNPDVPPAAAFGQHTYQCSDMTRFSSVPATDGLGGYLMVIRINLYLTSGTGNVITMGDTAGTDSFASWATHPSRPFRLLSKGGGFGAPGTWSGMTGANSSVASTGPLALVQLLYQGSVINVVSTGDSTDDGRGTYLGEGAAAKASSLLSSSAITYEHTNLAWSGATAQVAYQNELNYLASGVGVGQIMFIPTFFTNNVASGVIPTSGNFSIDWMRGYSALMENAAESAGVRVILQTSQPANYAVRNWGSSDTLRLAGDARVLALAGQGRIIFYKGKPVTGPVDVNGQQTIINSDDGIHQNEAGLKLQAPMAAGAILKTIQIPTGSVSMNTLPPWWQYGRIDPSYLKHEVMAA
jgi:hypothetical protein